MKFSDLGLSDDVLRSVSDAGYEIPTPIQEQAIPIVLQGRDVLGCAQTGTGKTAAFTLPMVDILSSGRARARMPRSLILEPTRELASQVGESFEVYGKHAKLSKALLIGGVSFDDQEKLIDRGVDVLIATPGRLLDHIERGKVLLSDIKILVIDEADRMLDMGFIPDVERIVSMIPKIRQTLFFSATMAPEIRRLADAFLMNPREISVAPPASPAETVDQSLVIVDAAAKRDVLRQLIEREDVRNALVFCNRKRDVDILFRSLKKHGVDAAALHGDLAQELRTDTLERFKRGEIRILVCSDVAARGLDIQFLSHVFNFDVPHNAEDYIHRIGRTGRAGRRGRSIMLATPAEAKSLAAIERLMKHEIVRDTLPGLLAPSLAEGDGAVRGRAPRRGRGAERGPGRARHERRDQRPRNDSIAAVAAEDPFPLDAAQPEISAPTLVPASGPIVHDGPRDGEAPRPAQRRSPNLEAPHRGGRPRSRRHNDEADEPVVGMGDHVPAFLMRSIRLAGGR